ncbi:hypothetical protein [Cohnella hongkongensis]|uniref:Uncharacterized protein n=1 Tax=Cohnella hongkongensis TaxID=178337 RepID=A0ABV9F825_9BACL
MLEEVSLAIPDRFFLALVGFSANGSGRLGEAFLFAKRSGFHYNFIDNDYQ